MLEPQMRTSVGFLSFDHTNQPVPQASWDGGEPRALRREELAGFQRHNASQQVEKTEALEEKVSAVLDLRVT